jgi:hypothetical protein
MVRHVYRDLLKVVRRHAKGDHFAGFVSQEFRKNTVLKDPIDVRHKLDLAKDYSFLVRSVHAHKVWLSVSYPIARCDFSWIEAPLVCFGFFLLMII